jgi:hypothetical protein
VPPGLYCAKLAARSEVVTLECLKVCRSFVKCSFAERCANDVFVSAKPKHVTLCSCNVNNICAQFLSDLMPFMLWK